MKDLYHAIDALNKIVNEAPPQGRQDGPGTRQGTTPKPKPAGPAAYNSVGDMMKAIATPGRQGVSDPNQSAKNIAAAQPKPAAKPALGGTGVGRQDGPGLPKPAAPKINPAVPAAGPVRANPINPQAMAATKAAASVVNAPKPAAPAPRAKVKATAANTKDFDKTVALQKKLGVTADGIMGPNTRAAMAAAAAKKPATPASQVTPTAGDPGSQQAPAMGTTRKVSTVAPGAAPAAAPTQDAQAARVAKSNAALAGDVKKAGGGILDKIGAGLSNIFKPSDRSVRGRKQAAAQAAPAGDFNFDDPKQNANAGGRLQTSKLAPPAAGSNAAGSNFASAADGSISRTDNPRQPSDAAPTNRFDRAKARMQAASDRKAARGDTTPVSVSDVQNAAAQSRAAVAATAAAPTTRPERGIVPGQGAGERTVSVGGRQVRGAEADRAINVAQAGADNARLRMGAQQAGMTVKDFAAQQQKANAAALKRGPSGTVNVDPNTF